MENIGLVLGGGGAKGAYEMGVWRALTQRNINEYITIYSGASIGAINCALIQIESPAEAAAVWLNNNLEKIFLSGETKYYKLMEIIQKIQNEKKIDIDGILSREGLIKMFEEVNISRVGNTKADFYVSVVNVTDIPEELRAIKPAIDWKEGKKVGKTEYVNLKGANENQIIEYLLASSAIPIVYPPVEIDGRYYIDGGVNDNLPIYPVYKNGYKKIIAVSCEKVNYYNLRNKYPLADILLIQPSRYLGNMVNGTLNFNRMKLQQLFRLGYIDTLNILNRTNFFSG